MRLQKYNALIVHSMALGEADLLVWALTSQGNMLSFVAKGARKIKSRLSASVQSFVLGEYVLYKGHGLPILRQAEIIEAYLPLRQELLRCTAAFSVLELCRLLIAEEAGEAEVFRLVTTYLGALKTNPFTSEVFNWCRLRLVSSLGYGLQLDCCLDCGCQCDRGYVSLVDGGLICARCSRGKSQLFSLTPDMLSLLQQIIRCDVDSAHHLDISANQSRLITLIVDKLIFWLSEGKTKTQLIRDKILNPLPENDC